MSPGLVWAAGGAVAAVLVAIPFLTRPRAHRRPAPSVVSSRLCTSCEQCYVDCPYDAIRMVERSDGRDGLVARVNPGSCVSCGICAGSCAPMGVGPPGRTGRDQLARVREFVAGHSFGARGGCSGRVRPVRGRCPRRERSAAVPGVVRGQPAQLGR